ncbi:MAG: AMP-binding protein [Selenomonas sp.]|nr:AMP-binding protein [Selenomonas sp.]
MWLLDALEQRKKNDATAIIYRNEKISYKELWHRSECIAKYLIDNGYDKHPLIIYGNKEIDIVPCMHAALKVGIPYVPVDTLYPVERLKKIASITEADLIVNFSDKSGFACSEINQTKLKEIYAELGETPSSNKDLWVKDDDTCYILFTSGSTGEPKGVPISKGNLINFCDWFESYCHLDDDDYNVLNQVSYSFDVSDIMLYIFLPAGKTLCSVDKEMAANPAELMAFLEMSKIKVWTSTPAFIDICCHDKRFTNKKLPELSVVIMAGEALQKNLVKDLWMRFKDVEIINGYGPTECTVLLTATVITKEMVDDDKTLPIGYLLPDGKMKLENPANIDGRTVGELSVVTKSASHGYYKNQELSDKVFWLDDFGRYGYRTGDLVFQKGELLYYVGRQDSMIKLHGYRIDLNDIEVNINRLFFVEKCVVIPVREEELVSYLAAFIITNSSLEESPLKFSIKVKNELRKLVPTYMVPKKIIWKETFPLNTNGKVDRKRLLEEINS